MGKVIYKIHMINQERLAKTGERAPLCGSHRRLEKILKWYSTETEADVTCATCYKMHIKAERLRNGKKYYLTGEKSIFA